MIPEQIEYGVQVDRPAVPAGRDNDQFVALYSDDDIDRITEEHPGLGVLWKREHTKLRRLKHDMIQATRPLHQKVIRTQDSRDKIFYADMNHYATASKDQFDYLSVDEIRTCFGASIWHAASHSASITHLSVSSDPVATLRQMRESLPAKKTDPLVVTLTGSARDAAGILRAYREVLSWKKQGIPVEIHIADVFKKFSREKADSLAIDLRNGTTSLFEDQARTQAQREVGNIVEQTRKGIRP